MTLKKTIPAILALLLLCLFSSCGKTEEEKNAPDKMIASEPLGFFAEAESEDPGIEKTDYEGHKFFFFTERGGYDVNYVEAEAETPARIAKAIKERNKRMNDLLGVVIRDEDSGSLIAKIRAQVLSGNMLFEAILARGSQLCTLARDGLLYDLNAVDRFDFSKSYWNQNACFQLQMGDKLYFTDCALNIRSTGNFLYYNKVLAKKYEMPDLSEEVGNGTWTMDRFLEMVGSVSADLNGDGNMNELDRFGIMLRHEDVPALLCGQDIRASRRTTDGKVAITLTDANAGTAYSKIVSLYRDVSHAYCLNCSSLDVHKMASKYEYARSLFTHGFTVFCIGSSDVIGEFADMSSEYGILPLPKFDEKQENYYSLYPADELLFALPAVMDDPERVFNVIEEMNYLSNLLVVPEWKEELLTRKNKRDDESEPILDLLLTNTVYDLGFTYDIGGIRTMSMLADPVRKGMFVRFEESRPTIFAELEDRLNDPAENPSFRPAPIEETAEETTAEEPKS